MSIAIDKYLRAQQSHNLERLIRAYKHFNMNREIAETLRNSALRRVALLTGSIPRHESRALLHGDAVVAPSSTPSLDGTISLSKDIRSEKSTIAGSLASAQNNAKTAFAQELLIILQMLIKASSFFSKDDCFQLAARCMTLSDFLSVVLTHANRFSWLKTPSDKNLVLEIYSVDSTPKPTQLNIWAHLQTVLMQLPWRRPVICI